jgi:hypothetical protein
VDVEQRTNFSAGDGQSCRRDLTGKIDVRELTPIEVGEAAE